jgi:hypothetical protein
VKVKLCADAAVAIISKRPAKMNAFNLNLIMIQPFLFLLIAAQIIIL